MRTLFASLVILVYPILAFNTFHVIKFFRKHGYVSLEMFPRLDTGDIRFIYLVFVFSSVIIAAYILMHQNIFLMKYSLRIFIAVFVILSVFFAFFISHKIFYHFDTLTVDEWLVKILTTSVPVIVVILLVQLFENNLHFINRSLDTSLLGIIPVLVSILIVLGVESVSLERASVLGLGAVLGIWTTLSFVYNGQYSVQIGIPLILGAAQTLYAGILVLRYMKNVP